MKKKATDSVTVLRNIIDVVSTKTFVMEPYNGSMEQMEVGTKEKPAVMLIQGTIVPLKIDAESFVALLGDYYGNSLAGIKVFGGVITCSTSGSTITVALANFSGKNVTIKKGQIIASIIVL